MSLSPPALFTGSEIPGGVTPVVILGAARSGTKFLRWLLARSTACAVVPRGIPAVWRMGTEEAPDDALPAEACTAEVARTIRRSLATCAEGLDDPDVRYLVEKTSANTLRVPFVHSVLPEARFIHILRDGVDVVESARRSWVSPPRLDYLLRRAVAQPWAAMRQGWGYARNLARGHLLGTPERSLWGPRYPGMAQDVDRYSLLQVCARQWRACVTATLDALCGVPARQVFTLRYEDLVSSPKVVEDLAAFLHLPDTSDVMAHYTATVRRDAVGRGYRTLSADELSQIRPVVSSLQLRLGYDDANLRR